MKKGETKENQIYRNKRRIKLTIKIKDYITTVNHECNKSFELLHVYLCELLDDKPKLTEHINDMW